MPIRGVGSGRSRFSGGVPLSLPNGSYSTSFPLTEDPLSQGSVWVNGDVGTHWTRMSVLSAGKCIGHEVGATTTDGTAVMKGTFTRAQWARGIVRVDPAVQDSWDAELEIRLLTVIAPGIITGYEGTIHVQTARNGNGYAQLARWDGWDAANSRTAFAYFPDPGPTTGAAFCLIDGDEIGMQGDGAGHFILQLNRATILTGTDTTYTTGNPGIGANLENSVSGAPGNNDKYWFESFACGNGTLPP